MSNNGFFSIESPLYKFMSRLMDMIKLNFMWLLCSIPIVTMGAATTAAYTITLKMVDDEEGYIAKPFLREFRANLKKGSIIGIIQLVAMYAIYLDFQFFKAVEESSTMFLVIGVIAVFLAYMHLVYAYALLARYENSIINTLKNSYSIGIKFFVKTIFLFVLLVVECVVFLWNGTTLLIGILIGPACIILTISGFVKPFFKLIENENEERAAQSEDISDISSEDCEYGDDSLEKSEDEEDFS